MGSLPLAAIWVDAGSLDGLPANDVIGRVVGGRVIAPVCGGGAVYATDNQCPHGNASLNGGFPLDDETECPPHQDRFDTRNGQPSCEPATEALRGFPVRVNGWRVFVQPNGALALADPV